MLTYQKLKEINRNKNKKIKAIKGKLKYKFIELTYKKKNELNNFSTVLFLMNTQSIGDIIIASGLISALRNEGKIVLILAPEKVRFLFCEIIKVDGFFPFDRKREKIARELKNIDLAIDTFDFDNYSSPYRINSIFKVKPKFSIGFDLPEKNIYDHNITSTPGAHLSKRMVQIAKFLGMNDASCNYALSFSSAIFNDIHRYAEELKIKSNLIIFNPFASHHARCLSIEQVNDALIYLNSLDGYKTVVFNMGNELQVAGLNNIILNPFADAKRSFALASNADIIISVDTSVVHLASALDIKQYCIYNNRIHNMKQDNNIFFGPNNDKAVQLTTSEHLNSDIGDDVKLFNMRILYDAINKDLAN